jgi:hypothetical protein
MDPQPLGGLRNGQSFPRQKVQDFHPDRMKIRFLLLRSRDFERRLLLWLGKRTH